MARKRRYQAINDLTASIETWLDNTTYALPHVPPDIAVLMAEAAFAVIIVLEANEEALIEEGALKDEEDE